MTKPTKWHMRPAKTQISLGIRPVWSESSLCAFRNIGSLATDWAHSEDSDQTGRMPRLIWVFAGRTVALLYPATQKVAGYYVIPSELWVSVRPSVRLPVSASFPCSNFSTFRPIFFKLCRDIGIGEEWYEIASGLISFRNNRVMALDVCQKCFALRFRALTLVPFYRFSSNFA